ncbi:Protein OAC-55, partial [Aphelenchoides avenae]
MGIPNIFRFFFLCLLWATVAAQLPSYRDVHELTRLRPLFTRNDSLVPLLSQLDYGDLYDTQSFAKNPLASLSHQCEADIGLVAEGLSRVYSSFKGGAKLTDFDKTVVFGLIDASGKPGPGFLRGHTTFYGLYTECSKLRFYLSNQTREFTAQYSRLTIDIGAQTCNATTSPLISWDLCVPSTCNDTELLGVFQGASILQKKIPIPVKMCRVRSIPDQRKSLSWRGWLVSGLLILIALLGVTASVYEYLLLPRHAHLKYSQATLIAVWRSFSFYSNITAIFKTKQSAKEGQIGPIHCMRFVTMCWIIMGHSVIFFLTYG